MCGFEAVSHLSTRWIRRRASLRCYGNTRSNEGAQQQHIGVVHATPWTICSMLQGNDSVTNAYSLNFLLLRGTLRLYERILDFKWGVPGYWPVALLTLHLSPPVVLCRPDTDPMHTILRGMKMTLNSQPFSVTAQTQVFDHGCSPEPYRHAGGSNRRKHAAYRQVPRGQRPSTSRIRR